MTDHVSSRTLQWWEHLRKELRDENNTSTRELLPCGKSYLQTLLADLLAAETREKLQALVQLAHDEMSKAYRSGRSTLCWRRLYTDACILRSLADCVDITNPGSILTPATCIQRLDQAIIIAGPAGEGRLELILDFISLVQGTMPAHEISTQLLVSPGREATPLFPGTCGLSIPRLDSPPSLATFLSKHSKTPFVLPGFIRDWPALNEHPWHSVDHLRSISGPARIVPVEVGNDYRTDDWTQKLMDWDDFLEALSSRGDGQAVPLLYLAQHDLFKQFPALRDDIILPDYVYAAPAPPDNYPNYSPPPNDEQLVANVWLGPAGTVSPAHTDPFFNFYAQVVGRKTVWLAPPEASPYMYAYSTEGSDDADHPHNPAANTTSPTMSNTSQIDVFASDEEVERRFPAFREHVVPQAMCACLEPGDLLFFPPGWWHALRSEETSFSVSMWF